MLTIDNDIVDVRSREAARKRVSVRVEGEGVYNTKMLTECGANKIVGNHFYSTADSEKREICS